MDIVDSDFDETDEEAEGEEAGERELERAQAEARKVRPTPPHFQQLTNTKRQTDRTSKSANKLRCIQSFTSCISACPFTSSTVLPTPSIHHQCTCSSSSNRATRTFAGQ